MTLYFITGNKNKFNEVKLVLDDVKQLDIDLPEIQSLDPHEIIQAKLEEAFAHNKGEFIVEDTSLYLECMNGLPGPMIKWFLQTIGNEGLYKIAKAFGNTNAKAKTVIGYAKNKKEIKFFEGVVKGDIVNPITPTQFGWDPLFKPKGFKVSLAEMSREDKNKISMRGIALKKLKEYLEK